MAAGTMATARRNGRTAGLGFALAAVVLVVFGAAAAPAGAHGAEGRAQILELTATGPDRVHLEVGVLYTNDNDPAADATVTAMLTAADGTTVGPLPVPRINSGRYGADLMVPSPSTWRVVVSVTSPTATAEGTVEVAAAPATTAPTTTTTASSPTGATTAGGASLGTAAGATLAPAAGEPSSGVPVWVWVGLAVLVAVIAAVAVAASRNRKVGDR